MSKRILIFLCTIGGFGMAAKFEMVREFEGIQEYRMSNGLSVLLFPDSSQSTVTVNITYLVGSRHEGRGETGMAHLLEHMLFKGTPQFPDAKGVLQKHGGLFNATTWLDRTNYFETMPASDENLKFGLQFEADRMTHAWIRKQDLVSEMTVVRNEFEIGENDPIGVLHDQMLSAAYRWHNYGKSTIGNRSDIERVPVKNLKAFYKKYYQPDNAVLMIAGKFDAQKALGYVNEFFAKLPKPKRKLDLTYTEEPAQDGSRQVRLMRSGEVAAAGVVYHVPAAAHADFAAIRILVELYAQEPGGFLYEQLIKSGKASEMFGMVYPLAEPGVLMMMAKPVKAETVEVLLTDLIADLEQKQSQAITSEAVERAKTRMLKNYKMMASDSKKLALNLSESIAQGDYRLHFWARDQIKTVSLEDVQRVAKSYLIESNRTAGVFVPTSNAARAEISQVKDIAGMLSTYRGSEQTEQGDDFEATPENLEKHISRVELQNGIKAAFLPKKTRGHGVKANFILRYGTETSLTGQNEATALLPHWMMRGTQKKSFQQIQDEFDRLQSTARFNGTPGRTTVEISSDRDNIVSAIRLVAEILKSPALSVDEFEILRKKEMSELEEALADPKTLGFNELDREQNPWAQDSIHYVPTIPERISGLKALDPAQVQQLYHDQYGASHLELALVGSFEVEAVQHALNEEFGSWKAKQSFERIIKPYRPTSAGLKVIQTPDKQMALLAMGMNLPLQDNATNYPAMRIGAYVLGESMQSRIWNRLREQGGLSYGAGSWLEASKMTANASLGLYAMAATDNAEKALNALSEELNKWQSKGITEQELQESKESFCSMVQNMLANDAYVVASLSGNLELGRTFEFQADLLQRIQALTTQEVLAAIEQYTKTAPIAQVKAGDFKH